MIIINANSTEITIKVPNNLSKSDSPVLKMKNTSTKKEYEIEIEDTSTSLLYYRFAYDFSDMDTGEYEYEIDGNKGLLRINSDIEVKTYDAGIVFKEYEC